MELALRPSSLSAPRSLGCVQFYTIDCRWLFALGYIAGLQLARAFMDFYRPSFHERTLPHHGQIHRGLLPYQDYDRVIKKRTNFKPRIYNRFFFFFRIIFLG